MKRSLLVNFILSLIIYFSIDCFLVKFTGVSFLFRFSIGYFFCIVIIFSGYFEQKKIMNILNNECDPQKCLAEYVKFEKYIPTKSYKASYELNRCTIFSHVGNFESSFSILESIDPKILKKPFKYLYSGNLMTACLRASDLAKAKEAWDQLYCMEIPKKFLPVKEFNIIYADLLFFNPSDENRKLFVEKAEKILSENEDKFSMLAKVSMKHYIGIVYFELDEYEKAKDYFSYTIEHGNKLHIVELSRQYLERINAL